MNQLVTLTEIYMNGSEYNPEESNVIKQYSLRETHVNPSQISIIREDEAMKILLSKGKLIDGLDQRARFTKIYLGVGNSGTTSFTVIGDPNQIVKKMGEAAK